MDRPLAALQAMFTDASAAVAVRAPARLHLGFLDPGASLGRGFGSLGLAINGFETDVELSAAPANRVSTTGPTEEAERDRAAACLQVLQSRSGLRDPLHLRLIKVLPAHAGFGSGTQLSLAIARAFAEWHGLDMPTAALAHWLGRGVRSGIGIAGFDQGGLIVDGGPGADGMPPATIARIAFPEAWRVLVVQDTACRGLSGADEHRGLANLPPLPRAMAADICHQVLMRVLPGAAMGEFAPFAAGVSHVQQVLGAHFAAVQGGSAYTSAAVGAAMRWIAELPADRLEVDGPPARVDSSADGPVAATGQSSWGPTGFAIVASRAHADALVSGLHAAGLVGPAIALRVTTARNGGATLFDRRPGARRAER